MEKLNCNQCLLDKETNLDNFYWRKDSKKWNNTCKNCISINMKKKYLQASEEIKKKASIYREENRDLIREKANVYNDRQEVKDRSIKWRKENKKHLRKKEKEWRLNNPEKHKEIVNRKSKKQRQKPSSKIKAHISRQINFALHKSGNSKRGNSVLKFLPYTILDLKFHLEKQFEPWMTWENYGVYRELTWIENDMSTWTWQIDHIIPQSDLLYLNMTEENFQKCWSLNNLRPLSSKQNIMEGSNRIRHK